MSEERAGPADDGDAESQEGASEPPGNSDSSTAERPLYELSDDELAARGYTRARFNGSPLIIRRSSFLLGFFGLPPDIQRYRDRSIDARALVKTFMRVRIAHAPADFSYSEDQFSCLVQLVVSSSSEPKLPGGSLVEIADALAAAQERLEERVVAPMLGAQAAMKAGARKMDELQQRFSKVVQSNPLLRFLLPPPQNPYAGLPPGLGLSEADWPRDGLRRYQDAPQTMDTRRGSLDHRPPSVGPTGLQRQLMGPSEMGKAINDVVARLQARSIVAPDSVTRLRDKSVATPEEVRAASADAATLARGEGYPEAAELLDLTNSTIESSHDAGGLTDEQEKALAEAALQFYTNVVPQMKRDKKVGAILALVGVILALAGIGSPYVLPDPNPPPAEPQGVAPASPPQPTQLPERSSHSPDGDSDAGKRGPSPVLEFPDLAEPSSGPPKGATERGQSDGH